MPAGAAGVGAGSAVFAPAVPAVAAGAAPRGEERPPGPDRTGGGGGLPGGGRYPGFLRERGRVRTETPGQSAGRARGLLSWAPRTGLKRNQGDGGALSLCGVLSGQ
ncbi:collagen alpha-2(I) chain-like [Mirounga angustirostris]|uniref:collagen alpha-2(I) chain-like n=1 Tax=Mirounga angustirostris TaxID=9716 RepID=UPI001E68BDBC|nr:collagen alpha-2(I) chain-like [Mirounga angustirostris]